MLPNCLKFICIYFIFLFISCSTPKNEKQTNAVKRYLNKNFNVGIRESKTAYYLTSSTTCTGCFQKMLYLAEDNTDTNKIYIFTDRIFYENPTAKPTQTLWIDTNSNLDRLKYHRGSICKISTYKCAVDTIIFYDVENLKSIN